MATAWILLGLVVVSGIHEELEAGDGAAKDVGAGAAAEVAEGGLKSSDLLVEAAMRKGLVPWKLEGGVGVGAAGGLEANGLASVHERAASVEEAGSAASLGNAEAVVHEEGGLAENIRIESGAAPECHSRQESILYLLETAGKMRSLGERGERGRG